MNKNTKNKKSLAEEVLITRLCSNCKHEVRFYMTYINGVRTKKLYHLCENWYSQACNFSCDCDKPELRKTRIESGVV